MDRTEKIKDLLNDLVILKRKMVFQTNDRQSMPRITPSQWEVLSIIETNKESTVKEVAKLLNITSSAATQLIEGLVVSGYLVRKSSLDDRRIVKIFLSKDTKKHIEYIRDQSIRDHIKLFAILNDKEFNQYVSLSKKLSKGFLKK